MARKYRKISPQIWNDSKVRELSDRGKLILLFLLTHPLMTPLGAIRANCPGLACELGWSTRIFRKAFKEILDLGIAKEDAKATLIWFPNFLKYNMPESPNVVTSWLGALEDLPECALTNSIVSNALKLISTLGEGFRKAFREAFLVGYPEAFREDFLKGMPNQEQEQEKKENTYSASGDAVHVCVSSPKDSEKEAIPELKAVPPASPRPEPSQKKTEDSGAGERYRTKKGRFLTGKRLKAFNAFWNDFALPKGKAEAADAWLDIPDMTPRLVEQIRLAARQEAIHREEESAKGKSPKWAQGWLSGRRWEDEPPGSYVPTPHALIQPVPLPEVKSMTPDEVAKNQKAALERLKGEGRIASALKKPVSPDFCQVIGGAQCS